MKKISRRQFLKLSAMAGAGAVLPWKIAMRKAYAQYLGGGSPNLQKFIQPLRSIGGAGVFNAGLQQAIPVAQKDGTRTWGATTADHYRIEIKQFTDRLHPGPNPPGTWGDTPLYGFYPVNPAPPAATPTHLGGVIAAFRKSPVQITFKNLLPPQHILPVDHSIPGADILPDDRTAVHIHGGYVPWISDGGPFDWWQPDGTHGLSFVNNDILRPGQLIEKGEAEYYYPNDQSARLVWYHDHAWGITRINAYAGIASGYVIYDNFDIGGGDGTGFNTQGIPGPLDPRTFYLVFQDKVFNADGSLFYANVYDILLFGAFGVPSFTAGATPAPIPSNPPSVVPEFFGDTILVNGTVYPYIEVEPRRYRFRMLNACNSRFLNPRLVYAASNILTNVNSTEPDPLLTLGPSFTQIGTEGGFLPAPVVLSGANDARRTLMAPAERGDVIVDFSAVPVGSVLLLYNDAPGPYPGGGRVFDYHPLNPKTPFSIPGFGPNTRTLLQIRVVNLTGLPDPVFPATPALPPLDPPVLVTQVPGKPIVPAINRTNGTASVPGHTDVKFRSLTLNEGFDAYGRLAQYIGTNTPTNAIVPGAVAGFYGQRYIDEPATEVPNAGAVEIWEIANLTADTHPLHFHLVNVQILARQPINVKGYTPLTPAFRGNAKAPDAIELGWKETVRMNPGEVIWVIMKFDLPPVPFNVPTSPRVTSGNADNPQLVLPGTVPAGAMANEYVWHCHILEHEEHDMMRPLVVVGQNPWEETGKPGDIVTFRFFAFGTSPYKITKSPNAAPDPVPALIATTTSGTFSVTIPAGATVNTTYTYTITDSTTPTARTVTATLKVV